MSLNEIITLFGIMLALAALPSASVALVVTRTIALGVSNGVAVTMGIILGDLVFILLAVFGLSIVAKTMGHFFLVVQYLGASYLLWLGYTLITSNNFMTLTVDKNLKSQNIRTSFVAGFILTLGDIKAIVFYASLLPVYIDLKALPIKDVLLLIVIMVFSIGMAKILYVMSALKVASYVKDKQFKNSTRKIAGSFVFFAGIYLIVKTL